MQHVNPSVNWNLNKLDINIHTCKGSIKPSLISDHSLASPRARAPVISNPCQEKSGVSLISAAAYVRACRTRGSTAFQLAMRDPGTLCSHLAEVRETDMNISWVPGDYHKFANVFSKQQAKQLPSHHSHDLAIHIENRSIPPLGPIYSLLPTELYTL